LWVVYLRPNSDETEKNSKFTPDCAQVSGLVRRIYYEKKDECLTFYFSRPCQQCQDISHGHHFVVYTSLMMCTFCRLRLIHPRQCVKSHQTGDYLNCTAFEIQLRVSEYPFMHSIDGTSRASWREVRYNVTKKIMWKWV